MNHFPKIRKTMNNSRKDQQNLIKTGIFHTGVAEQKRSHLENMKIFGK
jgi:hypothetical protein